MYPTVAIVGRPNVGKSTLFNRIVGDRVSITDDEPGITRDRIYAKAEWLTKQFHIIDTGGIDFNDTPFIHEIKQQTQIAIDEADVILFVCDIRSGITDDDMYIARMLYKADKPVVIALNKADDKNLTDTMYEFYSLGLGDPIPVSSGHGIGIGDMLDEVVRKLPLKEEVVYEEDRIKLCLIGRPNVGKSSLFNALIGEERVIVSDIEGTTRDSIDSLFSYNEQDYVVIDTAGLRKRGKVYENAEKYSVLRALSAIERSDICLILIDAETGIREQDKKIAGYAIDAGKAVMLVVNKWDTITKDTNTMNRWIKEIESHFQFVKFAPILFLSAKTKQRVHTIFPAIQNTFVNYNRRVQTSVLNDVLLDAFYVNPPKPHNGERVKLFYATQVAVKPPTFVLFVNDEDCMHFSYERYLRNRLRESFHFEGTPIKIILRKRD
ncbi:ribosome biogenesis GTPase Der [Candidatus Xianfuyuplasma coldseepsis]|uniref:GTPase Der n=1 Tax=Candidatus Xianfuyuplasma coldseepsis TaxID=2782163 RepID=A0A7L7KV75_9MOLU|nr:ribosome biogenesis GTPase Der [Xianfuyuplasma coldseepsis]QMS85668.1 ribosome biogenesis GTPase Der [Xianfuyuplasma coldseepsis]